MMDLLYVLWIVGGWEVVVIVGVIFVVCIEKIFVILDGYVVMVVVVVFYLMNECIFEYCIVGYVFSELVYWILFKWIGKDLLFDLGMYFGEGLGVVVVLGILKVVVVCYWGMVIFD